MSEPHDVVVTVPKERWLQWLAEGDLPGDPPEESASWDFYLGSGLPKTTGPGSRCYVVAHGMLRGYAPLVEVVRQGRGGSLVRGGGAVAVTLYPKEGPAVPLKIQGFRGFLSRWWPREDEVTFHDYATLGLPPRLEREVRDMLAARARGPKMRADLRAWALGTTVDSLPLSAADQALEDAQAADRARRWGKVLADPQSTDAERAQAARILAKDAAALEQFRR